MAVPKTQFRAAQHFGTITSVALRIDVDGTEETVTLTVANGPTDFYYIGDTDLSRDLLTALKDLIEKAAASAGVGVTVTLDANFKVVVDMSGASGTDLTILWSHNATTLDAEWLGWANNTDTGAAASHTSPFQPRGLVRMPIINWDSKPKVEVLAASARTGDGQVHTSYFGAPKPPRRLMYNRIFQALVRTDDADSDKLYSSLEDMWANTWGKGYPFRYWPDEQVALSFAELMQTDKKTAPYKRNSRTPVRWDLTLDTVEYTPPTYVSAYSLDFDGSDDYLLMPDISTLDGVTKATWSWWVKRDSSWATGEAHMAKNALGQRQFDFRSAASGAMQFIISGDGSGSSNWTSDTGEFAADTLYLISVTYDGTEAVANDRLKAYKNGVLMTGGTHTGTHPTSLSTGTTTTWQVGASNAAIFFGPGNMAQVAIHAGVAATAAQHAELYNGGVRPNLNALATLGRPTHWLRMGDSPGDVYPDIVDVGTDGTANGVMTLMAPNDITTEAL